MILFAIQCKIAPGDPVSIPANQSAIIGFGGGEVTFDTVESYNYIRYFVITVGKKDGNKACTIIGYIDFQSFIVF